MDVNWLSGYRSLLDSYFDYLRKGELNPSRGLLFTSLPDRDVEQELMLYVVENLRKRRAPHVMVDWQEQHTDTTETEVEFRQFFGQLWELQQSGLTEEETQFYLDRLNRLMMRTKEQDPATVPYLVLYNLPPLAGMSIDMLDQLKRYLFVRMEANLPIFAFFQETYSELLLELQRCSDIIWSLDEASYPAEFYLMHPHGLRTILLQNRRKTLPIAMDQSGN